jgi:DNA primase
VIDDRAALKQQIKEANDIVDVVGRYIQLRPAGPTFKAVCPFHDDHRPSMDVDPRRQRYRCWACGKHGDVFNFVQDYDKVTFPEAMEILARHAGISLEKVQKNPQGPSRTGMFEVMKWAAEQFQEYLFESPSTQAEIARKYLGERKLSGESVRKFGLGFAPPEWEWLTTRAANAGKSADLLETVGLIGRRKEGKGYYDRFRDRVMFPIRDLQGRIIAFGGRILPSSPVSADQPQAKYINSAETPLFSKSDQLYGLDLAKHAAEKAGYLAVVEGYTDVMMAHQHGISQVVATMGTALNERHIKTLKKVTARVVLVFDADAGGVTGVDRAMQVFVTHDLDLRIATLPDGLDPCDLLTKQGPEPFRLALEKAIDVFEYKLHQTWAKHASRGLDGQRAAAEEMLGILALSPNERSVKLDLMVNRIAHRLQIKEETLWARLKDLRRNRKDAGERDSARSGGGEEYAPPVSDEPRTAKAMPHERELVEVLLAEPPLVARAIVEIPPDEVEHPGLRKVIEALYRLLAQGQTADLDHLQGELDERLWNRLYDLQDAGFNYPDPAAVYLNVLTRFRERKETRKKLALKNQLQNADPASSLELLKKLRDQK